MNNIYLVISSCFLLLPNIIYLLNKKYKKNKKYNIKNILSVLLFINFILSVLFWNNPIKNGRIHKYDGILAKISFFVFFIYIFFYKKISNQIKLIILLLIIILLIMFYYSNYYSSKQWCSNKHILFHFIFHIFISITTIFAFL